MSVRKIAMTAFRVLQLAFLALVAADVVLDLTHPFWLDFLPLVLAYVLVAVVNRWAAAHPTPRASPANPSRPARPSPAAGPR